MPQLIQQIVFGGALVYLVGRLAGWCRRRGDPPAEVLTQMHRKAGRRMIEEGRHASVEEIRYQAQWRERPPLDETRKLREN